MGPTLEKQKENLEKLVSKRTTENNEFLLIVTGSGNIKLGKKDSLHKKTKHIVLEDTISLTTYKGTTTLSYSENGGNYFYREICSIPSGAYEQIIKKFKGQSEWSSKKPSDIQEFTTTLWQALGGTEEEIEYTQKDIEQMFKQFDKEIYKALEKFEENEPFEYCKLTNQLEADIIEQMEYCDYTNDKQIKKIEETIKFTQGTKLDTKKLKKGLKSLKTKKYTEKFQNQDQTLPAELEELAEKDPWLHLSALKSMEQKTIQELYEIEIENQGEISEYMQFLKFAGACKVQTDAARNKLKEMLHNLEKEVNKKYKQKLKKIRKAKELVGE